MSGGAFNYEENYMMCVVYELDVYLNDPDLSEKTKEYIRGLMTELKALHTKVKKLDYYLSGDSTEYK